MRRREIDRVRNAVGARVLAAIRSAAIEPPEIGHGCQIAITPRAAAGHPDVGTGGAGRAAPVVRVDA